MFPYLTVQENLLVGAWLPEAKRRRADTLEWVYGLFPRLRERTKQRAHLLSGGEQQMLAIGRGLMSRPRVLLLDEPSLGLAPILVDQIFDIIRDINQEGTTILLIEQNAAKALAVANRGYVLETGRIVKEGPTSTLLESPDVQKAYLGI